MQVSLVTLGVDDLGRASTFYEALGWRRSSASVDGTVVFFHGSPVLALFGLSELAADAQVDLAPQRPGAIALAVNLASAEEVDRLVAAAGDAGAGIPKPPSPTDWGGYSGYFIDLDGHLWEVAHNPGFELLDDGRVVLPDGR